MSLSIINLLISTSLFMLLPMSFDWIIEAEGCDQLSYAGAVAAFGAGLFLSGSFNSYLVDAYSRAKVCSSAIIVLLLVTFTFHWTTNLMLIAFLRLIQGAAFAVVQMSLGSTLVNDLSISCHRTKADYYFSWFGRFGMPLGMLLGTIVLSRWGVSVAWFLSLGLGIWSLLLLKRIEIPFRAPLNIGLLSLDRFFQPRSFVLFLNLFPISIIAGLFVGESYSFQPYALVFLGFAISLISQRGMFVDADLRSQIVSGLILMGAAVALLCTDTTQTVQYFAFFIGGVGLGWVSSRFLLYFLKLSKHCQRGTLQNTYMLCWESGLCLGFFLSFLVEGKAILCFSLIIVSLVMYLTFTHRWFMTYKDRDFKFREI